MRMNEQLSKSPNSEFLGDVNKYDGMNIVKHDSKRRFFVFRLSDFKFSNVTNNVFDKISRGNYLQFDSIISFF